MNEVVIVVNNGDNLDNLIDTIEIVKIKTVSYALMTINGCKLFVQKDSTIESINADYKQRRLRQQS